VRTSEERKWSVDQKSSEAPKVRNHPSCPSLEHVETRDLLRGKVTLEELKSKSTRTPEGQSAGVHQNRPLE
jgi:hypothetical protein